MRGIIAGLMLPVALAAQIPTRPMGPQVAATPLNAWRTSIQELPDGKVLVVDSLKRLVLLDSNLAYIRVIIDSIPTRIRPPNPTTGFLIPHPNGEVLYLNGARPIYDRILRDSVISAQWPLPRPDLIRLIDRMGGIPAFESGGRLVYAARPTVPPVFVGVGDTAYVFAVDPRTPPLSDPRRLPPQTIVPVAQHSHVDSQHRVHPIIANDLWAVVDNAVVVLRADGRFLEKWTMDGVRADSARLPWQPRIIGLPEKRRLVDSVRASAEAYKARYPQEPVVTDVVDPSELPDTLPAYRGDPPLVDRDGRVWVIENPLGTASDSTVALVIDIRRHFGRIVERRVLPPGRRIAGFGASSIYLWRAFGPLERVLLSR